MEPPTGRQAGIKCGKMTIEVGTGPFGNWRDGPHNGLVMIGSRLPMGWGSAASIVAHLALLSVAVLFANARPFDPAPSRHRDRYRYPGGGQTAAGATRTG